MSVELCWSVKVECFETRSVFNFILFAMDVRYEL